jgi:hypothetical protein
MAPPAQFIKLALICNFWVDVFIWSVLILTHNQAFKLCVILGDSQTHLSREVTEEPKRGSTIVDSMEGINELEPANLDTQIDFEKLYQREKRRRSSMEFYSPTEVCFQTLYP